MAEDKESSTYTPVNDWYDSLSYKQRKQTAKQIKHLLHKHKKMMGSYLTLAPFKEPVLFLIRRGGLVEFYENIKEAAFTIPNNPDPEPKVVYLNERKLLTFKYGKHSFKGYVAYEDDMFPLPHHPQVDARLGKAIIDKILVNYDKLKLKMESSRWQGMKGIIYALVALVGVIGVILWLTGSSVTELIGWATPGADPAVIEPVVNNTVNNTPFTPGDTTIIISEVK